MKNIKEADDEKHREIEKDLDGMLELLVDSLAQRHEMSTITAFIAVLNYTIGVMHTVDKNAAGNYITSICKYHKAVGHLQKQAANDASQEAAMQLCRMADLMAHNPKEKES